MASKSKVSTIRVAVCGLISSSYNGLSGQGAGKSCLCNRFIQSTHDKLWVEHHSVLNLSEFGSNVINNTHFLYWGEKVTALEDGQEIKFQIVEHTEFVDDSSLKPFPTTKPYHKRCMQIKLQSGGKVAYISPEQLAFPEEYSDVPRFPEKFAVDGFILCVDVSTDYSHPSDAQREFFDRLLQHLVSTKKPVVVAFTKYDRAKPATISAVQDILSHSRRQVPTVEVSAIKGVNVDTCFLVLAHLIDTKKPKTRIVSYKEAKEQLDERIRRNEEALQCVLDERLLDFSTPLAEATRLLRPIMEYQVLVDLSGQERVNKLIQAKLNYLKLQLVKAKMEQFLKLLPDVLMATLPKLDLRATAESVKATLRSSSKFSRYFVDVKNWKEDGDFLKKSGDLVPFEILSEEQGMAILDKHMSEVLAELRAKAAAERVKQVLNATTDILPGVDMTMLWVELGLSEEVKLVKKEVQVQLYTEYMSKLEQECVADLTELFLERSDLFDQLSSSPEDAFARIHLELKDVPRYKRLDHRSQLRQSQALKHIGSLQVPGRARVYGKSGLQDVIEELEGSGKLDREKLRPGVGGAYWEMDPEGTCMRLSILARTEDNAKILRSDFMNHLSGSGEVEVGEVMYRLDLAVHHGHHIHSLNTNTFTPQAAVAVVTTLECMDWLRDLIARLWLFNVGEDNSHVPPYRGMPLIVLALDKDAVPNENSLSEIHNRAQAVAGEVQGVCLCETPTPQPMRLVVTTVINQILISLVNAFAHLDSFFNQPLESKVPSGFNVAVCTLVGDPYPNEVLLNPLLRHQLVCCNKGDHTLFLKCALEKQHRTCVFSFNSMFNVPALLATAHLGFILVYSTQRPASMAVLKYLLPKLPKIPKLIIAMTTGQSHDRQALAEGQELANKWDALFITNAGQELPANFAVDFLYRAWFRRFSSWQAQNVSDSARLRGTKQTRALPDRPTFSPLRHSSANIVEQVDQADPPPQPAIPSTSSTSSLQRSPVKPAYKMKSLGQSSSVEEMDIYSNPVEQRVKKSTTLERKKKTSIVHEAQGGFINLDHIHQTGVELSDYASVEDAMKHTRKSVELVNSFRGQSRRSPSVSPPPPPTTSPPPSHQTPSVAEEGQGLDMYATVEPSQNRPFSPEGAKRGYDHLLPDDSPPQQRPYDHLPPSPSRPPRTDLLPKSNGIPSRKYAPLQGKSPPTSSRSVVPPPSEVYNTVEEREGPMYATIDVVKKPKGLAPPPKPPVRTTPERSPSPAPMLYPRGMPNEVSMEEAMYSAVPVKKASHQRIKSADFALSIREPVHSSPPQQRHQQQQHVEDMYSVVQKPRPQTKPRRSQTPEEAVYSIPDKKRKQPPPPTAPKPSSRSPTPNTMEMGGACAERKPPIRVPTQRTEKFTHYRSESFDTGLLPSHNSSHSSSSSSSPSTIRHDLRPDLRSGRSHSMNQPKPQVQRSPLAAPRSPSPTIKTFSSLPNSYRNRAKMRESDIHRARSKEELTTRHLATTHGSPHMGRRDPPRGIMPHGSPRVSHDHSNSPRVGSSPRGSFDSSSQAVQWTIRDRRDDEYDQSDPEWDEDAPPLPERNYSWSDIEDNDEDILQSDDDELDDEPLSRMSIHEHQKLYSSIHRLSTSVNTIEDIYNVVNRIYAPSKAQREATPPDTTGRSEWLPKVTEEEEAGPEQLYDTLESVVASMNSQEPVAYASVPAPPSRAQPREGCVANAVAAPSSTKPPAPESLPLTPRDIKLIKQQQKLLQKLQRKLDKEAEQRRRQEEKKRKREEARRNKKSGKKDKRSNERARYFGSPIASVVENDGIPSFVRKCVEIIENRGMTAEGLYRVSGKREDVLTLQDKYDQDSSLDIASLGFYESCIGSTLKAYFKLLPDPLIPNDVANQLLATNSLDDAESQGAQIQDILVSMPRANLCTLRYLMQHLFKVQQRQDANKMNASNLAIVFWPTLIRPPLMDLADSGKQMGWQLVMTNIIEHPQYVPSYSGELV